MNPGRVILSYMKKFSSEKEVERFLKEFVKFNPVVKGKLKAIGGYVRDEYLSKIKNDPSIKAKDLDILVAPIEGHKGKGAELVTKLIFSNNPLFSDEEDPQWITKDKGIVSTPRQMGAQYPIWQITFRDDIKYKGETYKTKGAVIEFADAMKESFPDEGSRQREVEPGTVEEDIERRDFTVNMLLKDLTTGEIEDLSGTSKEDIEKGVLRGHPKVSLDKIFKEDPLRLIRLIRFQAKYGWDIPKSVLKTVKRNAERINIVSSERIMGELEKLMKIGKLKQGIRLMKATDLLQHIMPEVNSLRGVEQPEKYHQEGDVYKHTLKVLENAKPGIENQMAALLHDIGKPKTQNILENKITFHGHDHAGAEIVKAIMERLKFDSKTIKKVQTMVKNHMRVHNLTNNPTPKVIRKFVREVGEELVESVLDLAEADELGSIPTESTIPTLRKKIEEIQKESPAPKKLVLDGKEIGDLLGLKGLAVGEAVKILEDKTLENPNITKEEARKYLKDNLDIIEKNTKKNQEKRNKEKEDLARRKKEKAKKEKEEDRKN